MVKENQSHYFSATPRISDTWDMWRKQTDLEVDKEAILPPSGPYYCQQL